MQEPRRVVIINEDNGKIAKKLQDEYKKLLTYRKDRLQKRYKRLQMDDLAYTPMDIPIQSKRASMSLFEALNMYAIARHTWPSSVYTPPPKIMRIL